MTTAEKPMPDAILTDALAAIADGAPVAWSDLERDRGNRNQVASLHLLEDVARAFRTVGKGKPPRGAG